MARHKDCNWDLPDRELSGKYSWDTVQTSILMDIRDELKRMNARLNCPRFIEIPYVLEKIEKNTRKKRKKPKLKLVKKSAA